MFFGLSSILASNRVRQRPCGSVYPCSSHTNADTHAYVHLAPLLLHRLVRELEKKFSDKSVLIIAQRRILSKPGRRSNRSKQPRPRSRTLTAVHDSILEDLVYPSEIVGKRYHQAVDGSKLVKVFIDAKDATSVEHKVASFASSYKALTGKDVTIEFKAADL